MKEPTETHNALAPSGITSLVVRYRAGDTEAAEILLRRFDRYLGKWIRLLTKGEWNPKDAEIQGFLTLLGSDSGDAAGRALAHRLKCYEREDLVQEVKLALLVTSLRYWRICRHFRYVLKERVVVLLSDPIAHCYHKTVPYAEDGPYEQEAPDAPDIDEMWVDGVTCSKPFAELTREERSMIRFVKHLNYSIARTAEIMGVSPSTVARALAHTREVLRVHYFG